MTSFDARDTNFGNSSEDSEFFDALVAKNPEIAQSANLIGSAMRTGLIKLKIEGKLIVASGKCIDGGEIPDSMSLSEWKTFMSEIGAALSKVCAALGITITDPKMIIRKSGGNTDN